METMLYNFNIELSWKLLNKLSQIDRFDASWSTLEKRERHSLNSLKLIATIQSVGSSTRIEGSRMNDDQVKSLISSIKITSFKSRDEQEVFGYYDTLNLVLDSYESIEISENHIHQLHKTLLKKSKKDYRHRGKYKTLSNKVVANYPDGSQKVIFNTTDIHLVKSEMDSIIKWTNSAIKNEEVHPLIAIAAFIYEFLSIHPYQDGNGRLSRLLTTLLLLKSDYDFVKYASVEYEIEKQKKEYYKSLMAGQKNRHSKKEKIEKWVLFFLNTIKKTIEKLEYNYQEIKDKKSYLNERQTKAINYIKENEPIKIGDLVNTLTEYTSYILKKDVKYLVDEGLIKKIGKGKATTYIIVEKVG